MFYPHVIFWFLYHTVAGVDSWENEGKLLLIFTLSRHGDRSPIHSVSNDPYKDHWNIGLGQLTSHGVEQHITLGKFIRSSYPNFISSYFLKDEAFFRSSGTDRTLMSANSFTLGLYPDQRPRIPPIYSLPPQEDHLLKMSSNCPEFNRRSQELLNSPKVAKLAERFDELMDVLQREYGDMFPSECTTADKLKAGWKICDVLSIWVDHRLPSHPHWLDKSIADQCSQLLDFKHLIYFSSPSVTQLRGGPLVAHILRLLHFRAVAELPADSLQTTYFSPLPLETAIGYDLEGSSIEKMRLVAYFAHDSTLSAFMSHLGVFNGRKPPLASCLIIELHHLPHRSDTADQFFVRFLFRNETMHNDKRVHLLWPPGCGPLPLASGTHLLCSLRTLEQSLRGTYVTDVQSACRITASKYRGTGDMAVTDCYYPHFWLIIVIQFSFMLYLLRQIATPFRRS